MKMRFVESVIISMLSIGLGISSCNETREVLPGTLGYDYYPLEIGMYSLYEIEEIKYLIAGFDTSKYQMRETLIDTLQSANSIIYLLQQEVRDDETQKWQIDSLWSVSRASSYLSINENNRPLIKLAFPVSVGKTWDGNSLNASDEQILYYESVASSQIDSIPASDHIRVIIEDIEENVTGVDLRSEVYARGVGLVEKDYLTQRRCTASDCGGDFGEIIGGRSLKQKLIARGRMINP